MHIKPLENISCLCYHNKVLIFRGVAQLGARLTGGQEAAGSSPVTPTMLNVHNVLNRYEHSFLFEPVFGY